MFVDVVLGEKLGEGKCVVEGKLEVEEIDREWEVVGEFVWGDYEKGVKGFIGNRMGEGRVMEEVFCGMW